MFWSRKPFNRSDLLAKADHARVRGHTRKAIKRYREILAVDPGDIVVHGKLAALLARKSGQREEAMASFHRAAEGHLKAGRPERATAVYGQAAQFFPERADLWRHIADIQVRTGKRIDAVNTLVTGSSHLHDRKELWLQATALLEYALELSPRHAEATLGLALLLGAQGRAHEALALLTPLSAGLVGRPLRRVRWAMVRLSPTPRHFWRWFRTFFGSGKG